MNDIIKSVPVSLKGVSLKLPVIIAGPCSAESEEQVLKTARELAEGGITIFRAGIWKPRTRPGAFEGVGSEGLPWLQKVREETGMSVSVEVATARHVEEALKAGVDIVWIGARTTANPFAIQEVADALKGVDMPVFVKNPVSPDFDLWVGAFERLNRTGIRQLGAIHRGFSSFTGSIYRNQPLWDIPLRFKEMFPEIPMINDPSHISGRRDLVFQVARKAMGFGFEGLMIESHCDPSSALSDKDQQVEPSVLLPELSKIMSEIVEKVAAEEDGDLDELRKSIDSCDYDLLVTLVNRMKVSEKIGQFKKDHRLPAFQKGRWEEVLNSRLSKGRSIGLSEEFISGLFDFIHKESLKQQDSSENKE